jgi:hypothetical protein
MQLTNTQRDQLLDAFDGIFLGVESWRLLEAADAVARVIRKPAKHTQTTKVTLSEAERAAMTDAQARDFYKRVAHITDVSFVFRHNIDGDMPIDLRARWAALLMDAEAGSAPATVRKRLRSLQQEWGIIRGERQRAAGVPAVGTDVWFEAEGLRPTNRDAEGYKVA